MYALKRKEYINENLFKIFFDKKNLNFIPGQHFSLSIPNKSINREYSSYTSQNDKEIGFLIRRVEGGIMTNYLDKMRIGEDINIYGPYGNFILNEKQKAKQIIFIASGTGIAPFVSIKESYNIEKYNLILGVRKTKDIVDQEKFKNTQSYFFISRQDNLKEKNYFNGRLTDFLKKIEQINDYSSSYYMICGNSFMISDAYDILVNEKNIDPNLIITESFF